MIGILNQVKKEEIKFKFNENLAFLSDKIVVKTASLCLNLVSKY